MPIHCWITVMPASESLRKQTHTVVWPFCHLDLLGERPRPDGYPTQLRSVGDHIRKIRMDRGLHQREAAELIGTAEGSIWHWESGRVLEPDVRKMPAIIDFLGYMPFDDKQSFSDQLRAYRAIHGLTQKEAAHEVGIDPTTWRDWENGRTMPRNTRTKKVARRILETGACITTRQEAMHTRMIRSSYPD